MNSSSKKILRVNPEFGQMTEELLLRNAREGSANARQLALTALAARLPQASYLITEILAAIAEPENQKLVVMGTFTVAMIGAMSLLENMEAVEQSNLKQAINELPPTQRTDMFDYFKFAASVDYESLLQQTV